MLPPWASGLDGVQVPVTSGASLVVTAAPGLRDAPKGDLVTVALTTATGPAWLVADATLVRALADRIIGGPAEAARARDLLPVERALWLVVAAALLDAAAVPGEVVPAVAPGAGDWARLHVVGAVEGACWLVAAPPPVVAALVVVASCELGAADLAGLRVGDVLVAAPIVDGCLLVAATGRWHARRASDGALTPGEPAAAPTLAADDVEVLVVSGEVTLAPGAGVVVPAAASLALWAGGRRRAVVQAWPAAGPGAVRVVVLTDAPL